MSTPRPRVVISKCIEFANCRYNGARIPSDLVLRMMPYVDFLPVCMEADMGLGVPRDPIRIVRVDGEDRLVQPATGRDVTEMAVAFTREHLSSLRDVDGFILKNRSPSCGIKDVRVYPPGEGKASITGKTAGFFARGVLATFPDLPVEDEARLLNDRIADNFLTRTFTSARFRGGSRPPRVLCQSVSAPTPRSCRAHCAGRPTAGPGRTPSCMPWATSPAASRPRRRSTSCSP